MSISRSIILVFNNSLLMFLTIVFITKFHEWEENFLLMTILISLSIITASSLIGSYLKNKWGWLLSVLPTFSLLSIIVLEVLPNQDEITWKFMVGLFITANFLIALFNTKTYQSYFRLKGKALIFMNFVAMALGILYEVGLMLFIKNF